MDKRCSILRQRKMFPNSKYKDVVNSFKDIDLYKYAAYRMALKIRRLQKMCKLHLIDLNSIMSTFTRKEFHKKDGYATITMNELNLFMCTLYRQAKQRFGFSEEPEALACLFISFLSNTFYQNSKNIFHLYQIKVVLCIFSSSKLVDKYKYIFQELSIEGWLCKDTMKSLFECLAQISEALGEKLTFGKNLVYATIQNCLQFAQNCEKISNEQFLDWLSYEPQTLVWLSTHYRLSVSEQVEHNVSCNVCKSHPMTGLRYKCLCCFGYNLCQQCFLRGFVNQRHQSKHLVQEYCQPATAWEESKTLLKTVRNKLLFTGQQKQNFMEFSNTTYNISSITKVCSPLSKQMDTCTSGDSPNGFSLTQELSNIIDQLEQENKHIETELNEIEGDKYRCEFSIQTNKLRTWIESREKSLQNHHHCMHLQLKRLRQLLWNLKSSVKGSKYQATSFHSPPIKFLDVEYKPQFESTPIVNVDEKYTTPYLPRNLSKFIKLHAEMDGIKNLSKAAMSVDLPDPVLYSTADIDIDETTAQVSTQVKIEHLPIEDLNKTKERNQLKEVNHSFEDIVNESKFQYCTILGSTNSVISTKFDFSSSKSLCLSADISPKHSILSEEMSGDKISSTEISTRSDPLLNGASSDYSSLSKSDSPESISLSSTSKSSWNLKHDDRSSVEFVENELQKILEHLESLYPKVTDLQGTLPSQKDKFANALTEMEEALKRLSASVTD